MNRLSDYVNMAYPADVIGKNTWSFVGPEIMVAKEEVPDMSDEEYEVQYALGALPTRPITNDEHWLIADRLAARKTRDNNRE